MPTTLDLILDPKIKLLLKSPTGSGKTTFVGSMAKVAAPGYVFDFDGRIEVLSGVDGIEYDRYPPDDVDSTRRAYEKIVTIRKKNDYGFVVADGLTAMSAAAMTASLPATKGFMPGMKRIVVSGVEVPGGTQGADYMGQMAWLEKFILKLTSLDCHVVLTAHEKQTEDEISKEKAVEVLTTGSLARKVPGYFNEIWRGVVESRMENGVMKPTFKIQTRPSNLYPARTCYPKYLLPLEEPDFGQILSKIKAGLFEDNKAALAMREMKK